VADQVAAAHILDGLSGEDGEGYMLIQERELVSAEILAIAAELDPQQEAP